MPRAWPPAQASDATVASPEWGYIFYCNNSTEDECLSGKLFGLPAQRLADVSRIKPKTTLFLFNCVKRLLHGVFEATSAGGANLKKTAFGGSFPAQVRVRRTLVCEPLHESEVSAALHYYAHKKFSAELSLPQVECLRDLFESHAAAAQAEGQPQDEPGALALHEHDGLHQLHGQGDVLRLHSDMHQLHDGLHQLHGHGALQLHDGAHQLHEHDVMQLHAHMQQQLWQQQHAQPPPQPPPSSLQPPPPKRLEAAGAAAAVASEAAPPPLLPLQAPQLVQPGWALMHPPQLYGAAQAFGLVAPPRPPLHPPPMPPPQPLQQQQPQQQQQQLEEPEAPARPQRKSERLEAPARTQQSAERLEAPARTQQSAERLEAPARMQQSAERVEAPARTQRKSERLEARRASASTPTPPPPLPAATPLPPPSTSDAAAPAPAAALDNGAAHAASSAGRAGAAGGAATAPALDAVAGGGASALTAAAARAPQRASRGSRLNPDAPAWMPRLAGAAPATPGLWEAWPDDAEWWSQLVLPG